MSERFRASNGVAVQAEDESTLVISPAHGYMRLADDETQALREFFLHERDQELGRWRWPENPDYVVYPSDQFAAGATYSWVRVMHERTSLAEGFARVAVDRTTRPNMEFVKAARAYFAAHPEPKPWHGAKPGEVWEVRLPLLTRACGVVARAHEPNTFVDPGGRLPGFSVKDPDIRSARRIWPEVSDG